MWACLCHVKIIRFLYLSYVSPMQTKTNFIFQLILKANTSRDGTYSCQIKITERRIDACKIADTFSTVPLISIFFKTLLRSVASGEKTFRCPLVKGRFILTNFTYHGFLPMPSNTKICFEAKTLFRIEKTKNFINGMTVRANFTYNYQTWNL